ncbi:MAG: hypothetical protein DHS20C18_43030 [Saprospiraceae bacterium]|nr:MAG: hypothetical protein DHS20C18_43030 [Saprospiraceae bacterium]
MEEDAYQTISDGSIGEFRDRGSKFIAYAFPVNSADESQEKLTEVKKLHPKARHHCYAYRLGMDQHNFRANDDGEPAGTAGRPILGQIDSFELTNVVVIVVRYFGGTKLGTSGLINAYKTSTADALGNANIVKKLVEDIYQLEFDYSIMGQVMNALKQCNLEMVSQDFGLTPSLEFVVRQGQKEESFLQLKALILGITLDEAKTIENTEGFQLNYLRTR